MRNRPKTGAEKKKERLRAEKEFLSAVLASGDPRRAAAVYPGVTWRHFAAPYHGALWRALGTLDLAGDFEGRVDTLLAERGLARADLADNLGLVKDLTKAASGTAWLEHELEAAGALAAAGGKLYVREVCEAAPVDLMAPGLAAKLGFDCAEAKGGERRPPPRPAPPFQKHLWLEENCFRCVGRGKCLTVETLENFLVRGIRPATGDDWAAYQRATSYDKCPEFTGEEENEILL